MWRGLAEVAAKYLFKGKLVYVEGKLRTRTYEDKEGIRRYTTEVVAENFTLLGRKSDFEPNPSPNNQSNVQSGNTEEQPVKKESENNTDVNFKENQGEEDALF